MDMTIILSTARTEAAALRLMYARELKVDQGGSPV
jgi:hypothetical protein